ncbi:hypothetical protein LshimejAT787_0903650 [Lyophyllum shimeji]|uniref:Uncharacterized protein n=1 Tax=Lyophyllum shimeji TaxID=47721 RepID=A0A9P3PSD3_LYOSH|nr:hypothetical protein LshimejAT787_0903650 [Lyophyllum shimeji]
MALTPNIRNQFTNLDPATALTTAYHGPYSDLLTNLFPASSFFQTVLHHNDPSLPLSLQSRSTTIFIVTQLSRPVFFTVIKPYYALQDAAERIAADAEMREAFRYLAGDLRLPRLFGLSVMGTRFGIYEYTAAGETIVPSYEASAAVEDRWPYDVLEPRGEQKLLEAVEAVKDMCEPVVK